MLMAIVSGAVSTGTGPSIRQKLDMGKKKKSKYTDELNIPIIKRKKTKRG